MDVVPVIEDLESLVGRREMLCQLREGKDQPALCDSPAVARVLWRNVAGAHYGPICSAHLARLTRSPGNVVMEVSQL